MIDKHHKRKIQKDVPTFSLNWLHNICCLNLNNIKCYSLLLLLTLNFLCSFSEIYVISFPCVHEYCAHMRMRLIDFINRFGSFGRFNTQINSYPDFPLRQNERICVFLMLVYGKVPKKISHVISNVRRLLFKYIPSL